MTSATFWRPFGDESEFSRVQPVAIRKVMKEISYKSAQIYYKTRNYWKLFTNRDRSCNENRMNYLALSWKEEMHSLIESQAA